MIRTRLIRLLSEAKKYIICQVLWQVLGLCCQIGLITLLAGLVGEALASSDVLTSSGSLPAGSAGGALPSVLLSHPALVPLIVLLLILVRGLCDRQTERAAHLASVDVKRILRGRIYEKLLRLGPSYRESISSAEITSMAVEGVEQLETYFGRYLSQFFYALAAPLILFAVLVRVDLRSALVLLIAVPLIPVVIMVVMLVARRLLDRYFRVYYGLADHFLESLQGMTTLKIYGADEEKARQMDADAEHFRKITMKVLSMQLNSTAVMDIVACGGAAAGIVTGLSALFHGRVDVRGMLMILLLAAEYFLPMRRLGSYFHIGMNGMKASDRIFAFLDLPEPESGTRGIDPGDHTLRVRDLSFGYEQGRDVLSHVDLTAPPGSFVSVVGLSGSGKSTLAGILTGQNRGWRGEITIGSVPLPDIRREDLAAFCTLVPHDSHLFAGSVRDNLLLGKPDATDEELREVLTKVQILPELGEEGLDARLTESGGNLSGGQRQRIAIARAILHDSPMMIFDEAASSIDMESEAVLMDVIHELARTKTVLFISHRLANVVHSDQILCLEHGRITERGTHEELLSLGGFYASLYESQRDLEEFSGKSRSAHPQRHVRVENHADRSAQSHRTQEREGSGAEKHSLSSLTIMARLLRLVRPLSGVMLLGILLGVAGFLCAIFVTVLGAQDIGAALVLGRYKAAFPTADYLRPLATVILVLALLRGVLHYGEQYCNHYIAFRLLALVRHKVFAALRRLCPAKLSGRDQGDLVSVITSDIELLEVFFAHTISPIAIAVIVSTIMTIFIGRLSLPAGILAALGYLCVGAAVPLWNGRRSGDTGLAARNALGAMNGFMLESIYGVEEALQYGGGEERARAIDGRSKEIGSLQRILSRYAGGQVMVTDLLIQLFSWAVFAVTLTQYRMGLLSLDAMITATVAEMSSFGPVVALSSLSSSLHQTLASGERVLALLDEEPETPDITKGQAPDPLANPALSAEQVTFSYQGEPVLADVSCQMPRGQIIGIHGRSGCGKSTLLSLFLRFHEAQAGTIRVGGQDVNTIPTALLRHSQSLVEQQTWLFSDTIAANIAVGRPGAARAEIEEAAKKASLHEFISSLPAGYDTKLGELGDTVSGGERQRIGIARAFLHGGDILLLDEPTSSLDSMNEGLILRSLAQGTRTEENRRADSGKESGQSREGTESAVGPCRPDTGITPPITVVIVSHRASTLGICDLVLEMDGETNEGGEKSGKTREEI